MLQGFQWPRADSPLAFVDCKGSEDEDKTFHTHSKRNRVEAEKALQV
jgi:hypothetical protein